VSDDYRLFKYSITCHTDDVAVMYCLRALQYYSENDPKRQIGFGGAGDDEFFRDDHRITLRFTQPEYRKSFVEHANRLFRDKWDQVRISDNDPAKRQRKPPRAM
jgi:hypothetical protein